MPFTTIWSIVTSCMDVHSHIINVNLTLMTAIRSEVTIRDRNV